MSLRILSYNIHKGRSLAQRFVLPQMRRALRSIDADIVFLQEICGGHVDHRGDNERWEHDSQIEYLAETSWPHHAYGKNLERGLHHHGNALLSKYPILAWTNIDVSTNAFEKRGLLHALIDIPNLSGPLHCIVVHLGLTQKGRQAQFAGVCDLIESAVPADSPLIVAGDFNDWSLRAERQLQAHTGLSEVFCLTHGKHVRTFPAHLPMFPLDRIYSRGLNPNTTEVLRGKPWRDLSDHVALLCEFK